MYIMYGSANGVPLCRHFACPKMAVLGCVAPESPCHWSGGRLACFTARSDDITGEEKPTGGLINQQVVNLQNLPLKILMVKKPPFWLMIIEASWGFHWFHFHHNFLIIKKQGEIGRPLINHGNTKIFRIFMMECQRVSKTAQLSHKK